MLASSTIFGVVLISVIAAGAQALTGFGFALVAVPLLALLFGPEEAVVVATSQSAVFTLYAGIRLRNDVHWPTVGIFSFMGAVGMPLGLFVLYVTDVKVLSAIIGFLVVVFSLYSAVGGRATWLPAPRLLGGFLSGAFLTATGMNGPPLVAALDAIGLPPNTFRATLQAAFSLQDFLAILGFVVIGLVDAEVFIVVAISIPFLYLGWHVGNIFYRKLAVRTFRIAVLSILLISGISAIIKAIFLN